MPRGRPIVTPLTLTPEQVTSLTQIANSRTAEHRQVQRARMLLGAASGKPQKELAEEAKLSVSAVARFLRKALQIGPMMALEDLKRSGRPATISDDARTWVRSLACTPPKDLPDGPTQALWSMETLAVYVRSMRRNTTLGTLLGKPPSLRSGQFSKKVRSSRTVSAITWRKRTLILKLKRRKSFFSTSE